MNAIRASNLHGAFFPLGSEELGPVMVACEKANSADRGALEKDLLVYG